MSRAEVLARLESQIVGWGQDGLRGRASEEGVSLYVVGGVFRQNSWRPVFDGRVESMPSGAVLVGTVGLDPLVRLIVTAMIAIALVVFAKELVALVRGQTPDSSVLYVSRWLLALPGLALFNFLGRLAGSEDEQKLRSALQWNLQPHVG